MPMPDLLARLAELEADLHYKTPPPAGERDFGYAFGRLPILLSAPHGAAHQRNGRLKAEDDFTAGMVRLVAEQTGAHALYLRSRSSVDANFDGGVPYKQFLAGIVRRYRIRFVLDVHGAAAYRDFGLALGTLNGASCPHERALILSVLDQYGIREDAPWLRRLDLDDTFSGMGGAGQETITRFVSQRLRVPAAQLEINAHLRVPRRQPDASERDPFQGDPAGIERTLKILAALVRALVRFRKP